MPNNSILLSMKHITKTFPGVKALDDVSLDVRERKIHALVGENGAGKSTLMKVLSGVYPYGTYDGDIFFEGKRCTFSSIRQSEQAGIVIIHQELALSPYLSIAENMFIGDERAKFNIRGDTDTLLSSGLPQCVEPRTVQETSEYVRDHLVDDTGTVVFLVYDIIVVIVAVTHLDDDVREETRFLAGVQ